MESDPTTIEGSTFQRRPAYRYIRKADRIPSIDEARLADKPVALVKLFDPCGSWTWYIAGYDADTRRAWGLVDGFESEIGTFDMAELVAIRGRFGLPIERDLHWTARPVFDLLG